MMRRTPILLLAALSLLITAPRWPASDIKVTTQAGTETLQAYLDNRPIFNITDFGAVGDATLAYEVGDTNCGFWKDYNVNRPSCAVAGTVGTDNQTYIQNAINAACAVHGAVEVPRGIFRVDIGYNMGPSLMVNCSDFLMFGHGPGSIIVPGNTRGNVLIQVCPDDGLDGTCDDDDDLWNVHFENFATIDGNPEYHGHPYAIVSCSGITGGTPSSGDDVEWGSGWGENGTLLRYDSGSIEFRIAEGTDDIDEGDSLREAGGGGWSCSSTVTMVADNTAEESHAFVFKNVHESGFGPGMLVRGFGDESVTLHSTSASHKSQGVTLIGSHWDHCPSVPGGGTCLEINSGAHDSAVVGNYFDGGVRYFSGYSNPVVRYNTNSAWASSGVVTQGNTIVDTSTVNTLGYTGIGIGVYGNLGDVEDALIQGNKIDVDDPDDTAAAVATNGSGEIDVDLYLVGNDITGRILASAVGTNGTVAILSNPLIQGSYGRAIVANGKTVMIKGNTIKNFPKGGLQFSTAETISVIGNDWLNIGSAGVTALIYSYDDDTTSNGRIAYNMITGYSSVSGNVYGISCGKETDLIVEHNILDTIDHRGINNCLVANHNTLKNIDNIGIYLDGWDVGSSTQVLDGAEITHNRCENVTNNCIHADDIQHGNFNDNVIVSSGNPVIHILESSGVSDYNHCTDNQVLAASKTIECGDGTSAGDDVGCSDDSTGGTNTYCGGNIVP